MNFIPFEVFSMGVFVNAMVSPFLNSKTTVRCLIWIARQCRPCMNPDQMLIFLSKANGSPSKMCISFRGRLSISIFLMASICWASDNPGQLYNGLTNSVKADTTPNDGASWILQQTTHIHDWTGHFSFWIKSYRLKYLFWYKIIWYNNQLVELELMDDCVSRVPVPNGIDHC
jgi:hypothetical protein